MTVSISECNLCGAHGAMKARYERYSSDTRSWTTFLFCDGRCCCAWIRERDRLPNPGIITSSDAKLPSAR